GVVFSTPCFAQLLTELYSSRRVRPAVSGAIALGLASNRPVLIAPLSERKCGGEGDAGKRDDTKALPHRGILPWPRSGFAVAPGALPRSDSSCGRCTASMTTTRWRMRRRPRRRAAARSAAGRGATWRALRPPWHTHRRQVCFEGAERQCERTPGGHRNDRDRCEERGETSCKLGQPWACTSLASG